MKIGQIMTRDVQPCRPRDSLADATRVMLDRDCGCVPVVDGNNKVAGILTDRDVCRAAYVEGKPLSAIEVQSVMAKEVFSCRSDENLKEAEKLMRQKQIRRIPVIDQYGHLVGLLALSDVVRATRLSRPGDDPGLWPEDVAVTLAAICEPKTSARARLREPSDGILRS